MIAVLMAITLAGRCRSRARASRTPRHGKPYAYTGNARND